MAEQGKHLHSAMDVAARLRDKPRAALARAKLALNLGPEVGLETAFETEIGNALALHAGADAQEAAHGVPGPGQPRGGRAPTGMTSALHVDQLDGNSA